MFKLISAGKHTNVYCFAKNLKIIDAMFGYELSMNLEILFLLGFYRNCMYCILTFVSG